MKARYVRFDQLLPFTLGQYLTITEIEVLNTNIGVNLCRQPGVSVNTNAGGYSGIQVIENIIDGFIDEQQNHRWSTATVVTGIELPGRSDCQGFCFQH